MSPFPRRRPGPASRSLAPLTAPLGAALAALLAVLAPDLGNTRWWDALNRALPAAPDGRVVVVGIDDASLRDYGRMDLWPRGLYAQALRTLDQAGATVIGLDVLLSAPAAGDTLLAAAARHANVVLATAPGEAPPAPGGARTTSGVSALNTSRDGLVREVQAAYRVDGVLHASFARQLAVAAGQPVPLNTTPHLLRLTRTDTTHLPVLPFRDVVNGNVRYGDLQGRVVLIGLTATGAAAPLRDVRGDPVPGVQMQARAVSTLLRPSLTKLPVWLTALLAALLVAGAVMLRGLWGFGLAFALLAVSVPLWLLNVQFPAVTLSLAAVLGAALVAAERSWRLRQLGTLDPLTGFGNRLAFTRAAEQRWRHRAERPLGLLLVDLSGFREVNDTYGREAGDELLRELAGRIQKGKRRSDMLFRWGADEFALLLENVTPQEVTRQSDRLRAALADLMYHDVPLRVSVGAAVSTPDMTAASDLVEAASRSRYRMKYQLTQRA